MSSRIHQRDQTCHTDKPYDPLSWNTLYPLYFDAKLSVNEGRRVPRSKALWWPQSLHIAKACSALGLQCVHEASPVSLYRIVPRHDPDLH